MTTQNITALQLEKLNNELIVNLYNNHKFINFEEIKDKTNLVEIKKYDYGIVDYETFQKKFVLYADFAITILNDLDITKCIFAGGSVFNMLAKYQTESMSKSDIDIFFYGATQENDMKKFMSYAKNDYCAKIYKLGSSNVYEVQMPFHRKIQLIPTKYNEAFDVISDFDLSYVKVMCDIKMNVHCTLSCLYAYKYWVSYAKKTNNTNLLSRCKKTLDKGMRLITENKNLEYTKNETKLTEIIDIMNLVITPDFEYINNFDSTEEVDSNNNNINKIDVSNLYYHKTIFKSPEMQWLGEIETHHLVDKNKKLNNYGYPMQKFTLKLQDVYYDFCDEIYRNCNRIYVTFNESHMNENICNLNTILNLKKTKVNILKHNYVVCKIKNQVKIFNEMYSPNVDFDKFKTDGNSLYKNFKKACDITIRFRIWKSNHKQIPGEYMSAIVTKIEPRESEYVNIGSESEC